MNKSLLLIPLLILLLTGIPFCATAQQRTVTGTVYDDQGAPLPGATVRVKGAADEVTVTNEKGKFILPLGANAKTLVVTFIGMQEREIVIDHQSTFKIALRNASNTLSDVVVIGYGTVKKSDLTGSVQSIDAKTINKTAPVDVLSALQGRLAGVNVTQNDGAPGAGISLRIRGANSFLGGTEPLYVIDGVPFNNSSSGSTPASLGGDEKETINPLNFLNPADIASITVLKDASATAIYGSRGANGVVLITTKKGGIGKDKVTLTATTGVAEVSKKLHLLDAYDYATYANLAYSNANLYDGTNYDPPYPGKTLPVSGFPDSTYYAKGPKDFIGKGTDWQDEIFRRALYQDYSVNISGGNEAGNHSISFNYLNQDGVIVNSNFQRYGINLNLNRNIGKFIKIGTSTVVSHSITNGVKTNSSKSDDSNAGVVRSALSYPSVNSLIDPATKSYSYVYFITNPYTYTRDILNKISSNNIFSSNYAEVTFLKDFQFKQTLGFNYTYNLRDQYYPRTVFEGKSKKGWGLKSNDQWGNFSSESLLTYNKTLGKHTINAVAGGTFERTDGQWMHMDGADFPNDILQNENLGAGAQQQTLPPPYNNRYQTTYVSFLGRVNYSYEDKYLLTASFRKDGASQFGSDHKWGSFPSFAAAWKAGNEQFIKNLRLFSDLKFRFGYGEVGAAGIGSYSSLSKLVVYNYPLGGSVQTGLADDVYAGPANPNLKWQTTKSINLGVDMGFLNNRLNVHVDVYRKKTVDLLQNITIPPSTGFPSLLENSGSVQNKGLEFVLEGDIIKTNDFTWNTNFNISFNRNTILSLSDTSVTKQFAGNISTGYAPFIQAVGHPIGAIYGYVEDGYYDNEAEVRADPYYATQPDNIINRTVGEIKYKNLDGIPGVTAGDRTFIGDVNPKYTFGITNDFSYKNWQLSVFVNSSQGNDIINLTTFFLARNVGDENILQSMYDGAWAAGKGQANANATWPKIEKQNWRNYFFSRRFVEDGSYVRIKNITLSYAVPTKVMGISGLRLSLAVNNAYTFTKYSGYDPEMNGFGENPALYGVDLGGYPVARTYNFTINCIF